MEGRQPVLHLQTDSNMSFSHQWIQSLHYQLKLWSHPDYYPSECFLCQLKVYICMNISHLRNPKLTWYDIRLSQSRWCSPRSLDCRNGDVKNISNLTNWRSCYDWLPGRTTWLIFCVIQNNSWSWSIGVVRKWRRCCEAWCTGGWNILS